MSNPVRKQLLSHPSSRLGQAGRWLRKRLLPGGPSVMMFAAYAVVLTALISFILGSRDLAAWRFSGTVLALSMLFVLQVVSEDLCQRFGKQRAGVLQLFVGAGLALAAISLGLSDGFNFLPFLLFMLAAQAFVDTKLWFGVSYTLALLVGWMVIIGLDGVSINGLIDNTVSVSLGLIFAATFGITLNQITAQTERAESLAADLQVANAQLEAARQREKELAVAEERIRMARDIHDGLGHHLTVLNVQLQAAAKLIERDTVRAADAIAICREEAQSALAEVRQSVATMRRTPLDDKPLEAALAALVHDFDRHVPLSATFAHHGEVAPLAPAAAMTLYRAAQEGLTNAQKHANAQHVAVTLEHTPRAVRLSVANDGVGKQNGQAGGGFGLVNLRERVEQLGGQFGAAPQVGGGFVLEVVLPVV